MMGDDDKERAVDELVGQLSTPEKLQLAADTLGKVDADYQRVLLAFAAMRAQRDEARELVRGALKRISNYEFVTVDQFRAAVARWDEEEKKR